MKRILITNNSLSHRGGTELFIKDIAGPLVSRGWLPIAFSTDLGAIASELRAMAVPVVDDLANLAEPPDLIHGQHHMDTMAAILRFPMVPVVHFCHGFLPWEEIPVKHPNVKRYVAANATCRERLVTEQGIPPGRVEVLLNVADAERFTPRGPLPEKISRVLVFSNNFATSTPLYQQITAAVERVGATIELVGKMAGNATSVPERLLPHYDLVVASGRCALEALASGCAVLVADAHGVAGLVTPERFDYFWQYNFGLSLTSKCPHPPVDEIVAELSLYHPQACQEVVHRIRTEATLTGTVSKLVGIYERVLRESSGTAGRHTVDDPERTLAESAYMSELCREFKAREKTARTIIATCEAAVRDAAATRAAVEAAVRDAEASRKSAFEARDHCEALNNHLQVQEKTIKEQARALVSLEAVLLEQDRRRASEQNLQPQESGQLLKLRRELQEARARLDRYRGVKRFLPRWLLR